MEDNDAEVLSAQLSQIISFQGFLLTGAVPDRHHKLCSGSCLPLELRVWVGLQVFGSIWSTLLQDCAVSSTQGRQKLTADKVQSKELQSLINARIKAKTLQKFQLMAKQKRFFLNTWFFMKDYNLASTRKLLQLLFYFNKNSAFCITTKSTNWALLYFMHKAKISQCTATAVSDLHRHWAQNNSSRSRLASQCHFILFISLISVILHL